VGPARMIVESLTPRPGIREQNRPISAATLSHFRVRFQRHSSRASRDLPRQLMAPTATLGRQRPGERGVGINVRAFRMAAELDLAETTRGITHANRPTSQVGRGSRGFLAGQP
jgi:hypothetical protein